MPCDPNERAKSIEALGFPRLRLLGQRATDCCRKLLGGEGFHQKTLYPDIYGLHRGLRAAVTCDQQDTCLVVDLTGSLEELESIHARHA